MFFILSTIASCVHKTEEKWHCIVEESVVYIYKENMRKDITYLRPVVFENDHACFRVHSFQDQWLATSVPIGNHGCHCCALTAGLNHHVQVEGWSWCQYQPNVDNCTVALDTDHLHINKHKSQIKNL